MNVRYDRCGRGEPIVLILEPENPAEQLALVAWLTPALAGRQYTTDAVFHLAQPPFHGVTGQGPLHSDFGPAEVRLSVHPPEDAPRG